MCCDKFNMVLFNILSMMSAVKKIVLSVYVKTSA